MTDAEQSTDDTEQPKRFGPVSLSSTDVDGGSRLYLSEEAIEESGLEADGAVVLQPYENGIHVIDAGVAVFGDRSVETDTDHEVER